jgi:hypothetical protein
MHVDVEICNINERFVAGRARCEDQAQEHHDQRACSSIRSLVMCRMIIRERYRLSELITIFQHVFELVEATLESPDLGSAINIFKVVMFVLQLIVLFIKFSGLLSFVFMTVIHLYRNNLQINLILINIDRNLINWFLFHHYKIQ